MSHAPSDPTKNPMEINSPAREGRPNAASRKRDPPLGGTPDKPPAQQARVRRCTPVAAISWIFVLWTVHYTCDAVPLARARPIISTAHSLARPLATQAAGSVVIPDTLEKQAAQKSPEDTQQQRAAADEDMEAQDEEPEAYIELTQACRKDERVRIDRSEIIKAYVPIALEKGPRPAQSAARPAAFPS